MDWPLSHEQLKGFARPCGLEDIGRASIREIGRLVGAIEAGSGLRVLRMDMGVPGLPPPEAATTAERAALQCGVAAQYPPYDGIPELKAEISRFLQLFAGARIPAAGCFPTAGAMQGGFIAMLAAGRRRQGRDTILFLEPSFPVNKLQARILGLRTASLELADARGARLAEALEAALAGGRIAAILYSSPNNPSWLCLDEAELAIIGAACTRHDVIAIEDLAYFGMDARQPYGAPGTPPFVPTVARYCDHCVVIVSASKSFSLAGQRLALAAIPEPLFHSRSAELASAFGIEQFGPACLSGALYATSAGISHSAQHGLLGLLRAVNDGAFDFRANVRIYAERAHALKPLFLENGFHLAYGRDGEAPLGDGFYFTVGYGQLSGAALVYELLRHGISAVSLALTGSRREGVRICVSLTPRERFAELGQRLRRFAAEHPLGGAVQ